MMNKEQELTARQKADQSTAIERYNILFAKVDSARQVTADPYWLEGYEQRTKEKNQAFKDIQIVAKQQTTSINHKVDLTDMKKALKQVEKACDRLDEYRADMVADVETLQAFVKQWQLFKTEMPKTATYDFKTGQVVVAKNV